MRADYRTSTAWNLAGQVLPVIAAVAAIPILLKTIGVERLGVLTLAWTLIGYFGIFDFGVGRAITYFVATDLARGDASSAKRAACSGLILLFVLGIACGVLIALGVPVFVSSYLNVGDIGLSEVQSALMVMSPVIPVILLSTGFKGILEAQSRFKQVNLVRIPVGVLTLLGPAILSLEYQNLEVLVAILAIVRALGLVGFVILSETAFPLRSGRLDLSWESYSRLLTFGGWLAVSNVVSPIMTYCDRFLIATLLSLSAAAIYSTVFDVMIKLLLIPAALVGVSFPIFCLLRIQGAGGDLRKAYVRVTRNITGLLVPVLLIMVVFAEQILGIWLGHEFARTASPIVGILALGILANGLAHVPSVLLHAAKRPDVTGKLHLVELPIYIGLLSILLSYRGIEGAALAWLCRVCIDALLLFLYAERELVRLAPEKGSTHSGFRS